MPQPRRRDGQPVAEREIAAQRAPAPPPSEPSGRVVPATAAAVTTAAVLAGLGRLPGPVAAGSAAGALAAGAVARAAAAILEAFERAHAQRRDGMGERVERLLTVKLSWRVVPGDDPVAAAERAAELEDEQVAAAVRELVRLEVERERTFQAKARERLARDLPAALAIADPDERREAVQRLLRREQRYAQLREDAIVARVDGRTRYERQKLVLAGQGVAGMYWRINRRLENCARCVALAGRVWPWRVLDLHHPPMHLNCGCRLWAPADAVRFGWATLADVASVDEAISMIHLLESARDPVRDPEGTWLVEAVG